MAVSAPRIKLDLLPPFDASDWAATARAFAAADEVQLGQHWRAQPEANFRPANVRAGYTPDALWVYAHLNDDDIFNDATAFNQDIWSLGDCFEIFLRPAGGEVYYEFHVSPENQILQLRWPDAEAVDNTNGNLAPFLMENSRLHSQTQINLEENYWRVLVGMSWEFLGARPQEANAPWKFSFGRYDYTCDQKPVLSSSSPHPRAAFHRQKEWGEMRFKGFDAA